MTFVVTVAVATTTISVPGNVPAAADFRARVLDAAGTPVAEQRNDLSTPFTFSGIPGGAYTAEVVRMAVDGSVIGLPVTCAFTAAVEPAPAPTPVPDVSVTVPSTLTITVAQE